MLSGRGLPGLLGVQEGVHDPLPECVLRRLKEGLLFADRIVASILVVFAADLLLCAWNLRVGLRIGFGRILSLFSFAAGFGSRFTTSFCDASFLCDSTSLLIPSLGFSLRPALRPSLRASPFLLPDHFSTAPLLPPARSSHHLASLGNRHVDRQVGGTARSRLFPRARSCPGKGPRPRRCAPLDGILCRCLSYRGQGNVAVAFNRGFEMPLRCGWDSRCGASGPASPVRSLEWFVGVRTRLIVPLHSSGHWVDLSG